MNTKTLTSTILFSILLCGCAIFPKHEITSFKARNIGNQSLAAVNNTAASHNWPSANWWEKYNDKNLNNIITIALQDSPSIEVAKARFESALAQIQQVDSSNKFNIDAVASYNGQYLSKNGNTPAPMSGAFTNEFNTGIRASYQFDFWGQNKSLLKSVTSAANAEQANMENAKLILTTSIVQNYFNLQMNFAEINLLQQQLKLEQSILANSKQLLQNGLISNDDQYQISNTINNISNQIENLHSIIDNQKRVLIALVGSNDKIILNLTASQLPTLTSSVPNSIDYNLLSRRADLQAQKWLVESSLSQIGANKAAFYPNFNITAFGGLDSIKLSSLLNFSSKQFSINPGVTLPIFNSGALSAALLVSEANRNEAIANYNQSIVNAVQDVYSATINLNSLAKQTVLEENNLQINNNLLNNITNKYQQGLSTLTDVLNSKQIVITEKNSVLNLKYQQLIADVALIKALGGGYNVSNNKN